MNCSTLWRLLKYHPNYSLYPICLKFKLQHILNIPITEKDLHPKTHFTIMLEIKHMLRNFSINSNENTFNIMKLFEVPTKPNNFKSVLFYNNINLEIGKHITYDVLSNSIMIDNVFQNKQILKAILMNTLYYGNPKTNFIMFPNKEKVLFNSDNTWSLFSVDVLKRFHHYFPNAINVNNQVFINLNENNNQTSITLHRGLKKVKLYTDPYAFRHGFICRYDNIGSMSGITTLRYFDLYPFIIIIDPSFQAWIGSIYNDEIKIISQVDKVEYNVDLYSRIIKTIEFKNTQDNFTMNIDVKKDNISFSKIKHRKESI